LLTPPTHQEMTMNHGAITALRVEDPAAEEAEEAEEV
jgi:hypothetical protein